MTAPFPPASPPNGGHASGRAAPAARSYATDREAVRALQRHLGLDPCFRTTRLLTCTQDCQWRDHCRRPVAEWRREW